MNYKLILRGNGGDIADVTLGVIFRDPWQRPQLSQQIQWHGKTFTIVSCSPVGNPDNATVSYTIEPLEFSYKH